MKRLFLTVTFRNGDSEEYEAIDYNTILDHITLSGKNNTPFLVLTPDNKKVFLFSGDIRSIEFTPIEEE